MYGIGKKDNEYARCVFDIDAPKTVWMALTYSFALRLSEDRPDAARKTIIAEWRTLNQNGIVPQHVRLLKATRAKETVYAFRHELGGFLNKEGGDPCELCCETRVSYSRDDGEHAYALSTDDEALLNRTACNDPTIRRL